MTLRTVRPATINNTKLWAMLSVGLGLAILALQAWDYQSFAYARQAPLNSSAWAALAMGALFSGMTLLMLEGRRSRRLAHLYPSSSLLVLPLPAERIPSNLPTGTSGNGPSRALVIQ